MGGNETYKHTDIQTNVKMEEEINRGNEPKCIKAHICFSAIPPPPTYYIKWVAPLSSPVSTEKLVKDKRTIFSLGDCDFFSNNLNVHRLNFNMFE